MKGSVWHEGEGKRSSSWKRQAEPKDMKKQNNLAVFHVHASTPH